MTSMSKIDTRNVAVAVAGTSTYNFVVVVENGLVAVEKSLSQTSILPAASEMSSVPVVAVLVWIVAAELQYSTIDWMCPGTMLPIWNSLFVIGPVIVVEMLNSESPV